MNILFERGINGLATAYVASFGSGRAHLMEFVDSLSGSGSIEEKWVVVLSSQFGCPVGCLMCDAAGYYMGEPTVNELLEPLDYLVKKRFEERKIPTKKFKVQFARMGEPTLNRNVIGAIKSIPERYDAPGFMPCISTVAPAGSNDFFNDIIDLNHDIFNGWFQMQFSIHSTSEKQRNTIIPIKKWSLKEISKFGEQFYTGGRKVSLNFALAPQNELDANVLVDIFSPEIFAVKITPVNPTENALKNEMVSEINNVTNLRVVADLRDYGFDVIESIGDPRENSIGTNCGQLIALWKNRSEAGTTMKG